MFIYVPEKRPGGGSGRRLGEVSGVVVSGVVVCGVVVSGVVVSGVVVCGVVGETVDCVDCVGVLT